MTSFFGNDLFASKKDPIVITPETQVIFVADMFQDDYAGGAEITSQVLIDSSPFKVFQLHTRDLTVDHLKQGVDKFWIFGNFADINPQLIPSIVGNLKYTVLEYDYKFCRFRSTEKHRASTGSPCDCHTSVNGKMVSAFYYGARGLWWMSEKQKQRYFDIFPFLNEKDNVVLSSVFDPYSLGYMENLRHNAPKDRTGWIVLGSSSWVKGAAAAEQWCKDNNKSYELVWNLPYNELLEKLSKAEGFVCLPEGADTCPRMVIEAKLLGCKLITNDNVQHANEEWFATDDLQSIKDYLFTAREIFWSGVKHMMEYQPKISGYMTVYNCNKQKYPWKQAIESMTEFCDEICIVDGGSTDGTWEELVNLICIRNDSTLDQLSDIERTSMIELSKPGAMTRDKTLRIKQITRDWSHPRHAVYDGMQKAEARKMCTGDFCWQMDSDEIVHEDDAKKIRDFCGFMPKEVDVLSLPVIEYWGGPDKVRLDIQPWKWRLSRNKPNITHGIPVELRTTDSEGNLMAIGGTDGCDMIDSETGQRLPHASFYTPEVEQIRLSALAGNPDALTAYQNWFEAATTQLPGVFHYSWYDLERKIKLYRDYWQSHWLSLWGKDVADTAENNMMFDVPWSEVTDDMIHNLATELAEKTGGHIWHTKWSSEKCTPHLITSRTQPKFMLGKTKVEDAKVS